MARQPMTEEEKKAFGEKMKAAREAKKAQSPISQTPTAQTTSPIPATVEQDPAVKAKLAELDAAIERANKAAENAEVKASANSGEFQNPNMASPTEIKNVETVRKGKIATMRDKLKEQPKIRIFVPTEGKEAVGTVLPITINGLRLNVPKGVYTEVPQQVADIIMESLNQTAEAIENNPLRLDIQRSSKDKAEALDL